MAEWLSLARAAATRARDAGAERVDPGVVAGLLGRYDQIIAKGCAANPPPARHPGQRGRGKQPPAANLLGRLDARRGAVSRFLVDLRVPFSSCDTRSHVASGLVEGRADSRCRLRSPGPVPKARPHPDVRRW